MAAAADEKRGGELKTSVSPSPGPSGGGGGVFAAADTQRLFTKLDLDRNGVITYVRATRVLYQSELNDGVWLYVC